MIKVKNVTKVFNETNKAVDNISFEVNPGEIVGFIGPNGSGKTTTLKLLTGIYQKDSGEITVAGYDIDKDALEAKKNIGYISDSPDMFLRLKGVEFLNLIADIYEVSTTKRKERIKELTKAFGLEDILESEMISYSHGMRQKMMVIAALIHEPDVIEDMNVNPFDLILAGHSHAGQIRLPFIGAFILPEGAQKYYENHYKIENSDLYISNGLGVSNYNFRLFNTPSYSLYRLVQKTS